VPVAVPALEELLASAHRRALHLELRDFYGGSPDFAAWLDGQARKRTVADDEWAAVIAPLVARGVDLRRARIVSEPASAYIRYEYEATEYAAIAAGERVRWLPRQQAIDVAVPPVDFWLVDEDVLFNHFSGDGMLIATELSNAPQVVSLCARAFEEVWSRSIDHADFRLTPTE
jgi:hypothetical protein